MLYSEFPDIERFITLMEVKSNLNSGSEKPKNFKGVLEFKNVRYEYPSRPGQEVIKGLSVKF
jgi:ABC-type multidrug transport system fused ATPase/permease subunit